MSGQESFQPSMQSRVASPYRARTAFAPQTPRQNHLLAALPVADYERLLAHLEPVPLPRGWAVHSAGDGENFLYFLTSGIVSRFCLTENGSSAGFAVTGSEGVIGVASFLGGGGMASHAVVLSAGNAYRLAKKVVNSEFERDTPLTRLLLRYTLALITQTTQTAVCNRHHSLEQQLCCWLLSFLDRLPSNVLTLTHELIADMLGVRREGVTEAAGNLQSAGLIRYSRGQITVIDRPKLEGRACECYAVVKRECERLTPRENTVRNIPARTARATPTVQVDEDFGQLALARSSCNGG